ncbi:EAL domain-containing protein [Salinivibrio sp. YCSC6]|nr:EAL domain-containing protein [Salinivibrio sp. YCSC6]
MVRVIGPYGGHRWQHCEPRRVYSRAEAFGHIRDIDEWVANYVLTTRAQELADSGLRFNINLSAHSISDPNFQADSSNWSPSPSSPPIGYVFEITESALISHLNSAISFVDELRAYGAHVRLTISAQDYAPSTISNCLMSMWSKLMVNLWQTWLIRK